MRYFIGTFLTVILGVVGLVGCTSDADVASHNLSKAADDFRVERHIVFINGITDTTMLEITGMCSLGNSDTKYISVTCRKDNGTLVKHFLLRSDNVTVVAEQTAPIGVSTQHYSFFFKPSAVVPDVDVR